jgi:Holliday junction DNA helicase RuvB
MFKNLFKKIDIFFFDDEDISKQEKFFSNVIGYPEIKKLLLRAIISKEPVNVLLTGPPASSKSVFLLDMLQGLEDAYFIDAVGASGS